MQVEVMEQRSRWQLGGALAHGLANVQPLAKFQDAAVMRQRLLRIDSLLKAATDDRVR